MTKTEDKMEGQRLVDGIGRLNVKSDGLAGQGLYGDGQTEKGDKRGYGHLQAAFWQR